MGEGEGGEIVSVGLDAGDKWYDRVRRALLEPSNALPTLCQRRSSSPPGRLGEEERGLATEWGWR